MGVRFPLPAPIKSMLYQINASSDAFFCAQTMTKVLVLAGKDSDYAIFRFRYALGQREIWLQTLLRTIVEGAGLRIDGLHGNAIA